MNIKPNEGKTDRILRALVAVLLWVLAYFWVTGVWTVVLGILGAILLFTAITGFCGFYTILKINTLKK